MDPNEWPPPAVFQTTDPRRRLAAGHVAYLRVEVVGFSDKGTPYVQIINKDRTPCDGTSIWAVDPAWWIDGSVAAKEVSDGRVLKG